MDFGKLVNDIQKEGREYSASKLEVAVWYHVTALELVPSVFGGSCVKAHLDNGDRVFLPPKMSKGLAPYVGLLRQEDQWALRFTGYKEAGTSSTFRTPLFEMEKRKVLILEDIVLKEPYPIVQVSENNVGGGEPGLETGGKDQSIRSVSENEVKSKRGAKTKGGKSGKRGSGDLKTPNLDAVKKQKLHEKLKEKEMDFENQIHYISDSEDNMHFVPEIF